MKVLIVDDEDKIRRSLSGLLMDEGYQVECCESGEAALKTLQKQPVDVILLDIYLKGIDGLKTLERIRQMSENPVVIMMSGQADMDTAVRATKLGADNFFEKPLNPDRILLELKHIQNKLSMASKIVSLENRLDQDELIGTSDLMGELKDMINKAGPTDGRVLILGENGTGKELVARAIHRASFRSNGPFVGINCAALPKDLVESELFGYEKGAFTGAFQRKPGRFELANGGTLFLDEIGDMSSDTQAKLLRVLEENEAVRLGGTRSYPFDVRIIAATNKNLSDLIREKLFREDLFYRLNVIPVHVPPLRQRKTDIPELAEFFLRGVCTRTGMGQIKWEPDALPLLQNYEWPGNVRELRNFVERMAIISREKIVSAKEVLKNLPGQFSAEAEGLTGIDYDQVSFRERITAFEKNLLLKAYHEAGGNVSRLARMLKMDRAYLHRKLKQFDIK